MESSIAWYEIDKENINLNTYKSSLKDLQDASQLTDINFKLATSRVALGNECDECRLPFNVELVAATVNCPTRKLATIVNENVHRLYKFD